MLYILEEDYLRERLTDKELLYAKDYVKIVHECLWKSMLQHLPESISRIDDKEDIVQPVAIISPSNLNAHTFFKVTDDTGEFMIDNRDYVDLKKGETVLLRYNAVQQLFLEEKLEMI